MMLRRVALMFLPLVTLHLMLRGDAQHQDRRCAAGCRCDADGVLWSADCSDLGLTDPPSDIHVLTTYLDLSMNDFTSLPVGSLSRLQALRELRLAGNKLNTLHKYAFAGLFHLQVLTLQNNHLSQVPTESLKMLRNLRSLRLDANSLSTVPRGSFEGLGSLRYLWMDDNRLNQVPAAALAGLPSLQALTLALNQISHLPDRVFHTLSHLVVLQLHNNKISSLATRCFEGLHNLETLDMSSNSLDSFPIAIGALPNLHDLNLHNNNIKSIPEYAFIGNPSLETINLHNNLVQSIGQTSFQNLPQLVTLTLSGTALITRFPNLTGTSSVKSLSITGTHISELPSSLCGDLPRLRQLNLSHNRILSLPRFTDCRKLQKIDLQHNFIHVIQAGTFQKMSELSSLDFSFNRLSAPPLGEELSGTTRLSLAGNPLRPHLLPGVRTAELPFGFQRRVLRCFSPGKTYPSVLCTTESGLLLQDPRSSPETPWMAHVCVWAVFLPSVALNGLVLTLVFLPGGGPVCGATRAQRLLLAFLFSLRLLAGLCGAAVVLVEDLDGPPDPPGPEASCRAGAVVLMTAAVWKHRGDRAPSTCRSGVQRRRLAAVVLCCSGAVLVLLIASVWAVRDEVSVRTGGATRCWGPNAACAALTCGGYLLLSAVHVLFFCRRPRRLVTTTHARGVTCLLLANALSCSAAEALLWCPPAVLQPAGGSPFLLLLALPALLDPLLYAVLHLQHHQGDASADRLGDGKH